MNVRRREFPVLLRLFKALHEALLLFLARHIQEEFQDDGSLSRQIVLEMRDVSEPLVPDPLSDERRRQLLAFQNLVMHAKDGHCLRVRPLEYRQPPTRGKAVQVTKQKIVLKI